MSDNNFDRLQRLVAHQDMLLKLSREVHEMAAPDDLEIVLLSCLKEMQRVGLDVYSIAIHQIVDADNFQVETTRLGPNGLLAVRKVRTAYSICEVWQSGKSELKRDMEQDVRKGPEAAKGVAAFRATRFEGALVRCFLDVPFSEGVFSVHSLTPNVFSDADIKLMQDVAEVVAVGVARMNDLIRLRQREAELVEAQSVQKDILTHAHCLLWYATVEAREGEADGTFHWKIEVSSEEAAHDFLPLDVVGEDTYTQAWFKSKLPEDQLSADRVSYQALTAGRPSYQLTLRSFEVL